VDKESRPQQHTWNCGALVIKAHKFILSTHSETLRVAFNSEGLKEGRTGIYRIEEEHWSLEILQYVIRWMYMHCIENAGDKAWVYFFEWRIKIRIQ
jgi:hypothetical protein